MAALSRQQNYWNSILLPVSMLPLYSSANQNRIPIGEAVYRDASLACDRLCNLKISSLRGPIPSGRVGPTSFGSETIFLQQFNFFTNTEQ